MGHDGFQVDPAALGQAEQGVREAVAELGGMAGWGRSEAGAEGMGLVEGIGSAAGAVGHETLAAALELFADKWEWGVRFLVDDGVDTADALRDTRAWYEKVEGDVVSLIKQAAHAAYGNPMEDDAAWADKPVGDIVDEQLPDFSAASALESHQRTAEQAKGLLRGALESHQRTVEQAEGVTGWDLNSDGRTGGDR